MSPIMAIKIIGRAAKAPIVQEILTKYGCNIKTRVGFHEASEDHCSMDGVVLLQLCGDPREIENLFAELDKLEGVIPKFVEF
jgi:hypothetical protein